MKNIDIFLASSLTDLKEERQQISDYIRYLNDNICQDFGISIKVRKCEDFDEAISIVGKQNEYNSAIRKCDVFIVMFWHTVGQYTIEEFDVALEEFYKSGAPKMYVFFKAIDSNESVNSDIDRFKERLSNDINHYYTVFEHVDSIKLKLLLALMNNFSAVDDLQIGDTGQVLLNGKLLELLDTKNIPAFSRNEELRVLYKERLELQDKLYNAKTNINDNLDEVISLSVNINEKNKKILELQEGILNALTRTINLNSNGERVTVRAQKAINLLEEGNFSEALLILSDEERKQSAKEAMLFIDHGKLELQAVINEVLLKISALQVNSVGEREYNQICDLYEEAWSYVIASGITPYFIKEQAQFLYEQTRYLDCIEKCNKYLNYVEYAGGNSPKLMLSIYLYMAKSYIILSELGKAYIYLAKCKYIISTMTDVDIAVCSEVYITEAELLSNEQRVGEAEQVLLQCMDELENREDKDTLLYKNQLAYTLKHIGIVQRKQNKVQSISSLQRAIEIVRTTISMGNNNVKQKYILSDLLQTSAVVQKRFGLSAESRRTNAEAIEILRELAEYNPIAYKEKLSTLLSNTGIGLYDSKEYSDGLIYAEEAVSIRESLFNENPARYQRGLAISLRSLASIQANLSQNEDAKKNFVKAISLFEKMERDGEKENKAQYAILQKNYGKFLLEQADYVLAEQNLVGARDKLSLLLVKNREAERVLSLAQVDCYLIKLYVLIEKTEFIKTLSEEVCSLISEVEEMNSQATIHPQYLKEVKELFENTMILVTNRR